mgnify:CR=1 FL=1
MGTKLKDMASVEMILNEMSLVEKASLVIGGSPMSSMAMEKYGIPSIWTSDCCNGLNIFQYTVEKTYRALEAAKKEKGEKFDRESFGTMGGLLVTVNEMQKKAKEEAAAGIERQKTHDVISYPTGISQASTWNPHVANICAKTVAKEFVKYGVDLILSPNINIHRDPLCGRLTESYSEDPYLVSRIAEAVVCGLQDEGVIADPKHFAANSQEKDRLKINEKIPMRALREIYLKQFEIIVKEAHPYTIMSSYNLINGIHASENKELLTGILRDEWGFDGLVTTDWWTFGEHYRETKAGNDIKMAAGYPERIKEAYEKGFITEAEIRLSARRILNMILKID